MSKPVKSTTTWTPPADPEGDRMAAGFERRHKMDDAHYPAYLDKVKAELAANPERKKKPWPTGYRPKTRNPNAPKGKRWGHWDEGAK